MHRLRIRPRSRRFPTAILALLLAALACSLPLTPEPPPEPTPLPGTGLVAYIGADGNIYTLHPDTPDPTPITTDAQPEFGVAENIVLYRHPTWAPDGRSLAFVSIRSGEDGDGNGLWIAQPGSDSPAGLEEIFFSQSESPFYLYWAPDSASLTFLTSTRQSNTLAMRQAFPGGAESRILDTGQPYYWHWSPDAAQILVHIGGARRANPAAVLALIDPADRSAADFDSPPGRFQAPAWAPDGESFLAVVEADGGGEELARFDRIGERLGALLEVDSLTFFSWSPDGSRIALHPKSPSSPVLGPLLVLDAGTGAPVWSSLDRNTLAYFWSPDGSRLAFFHLEGEGGIEALARPVRQTGEGQLSLSVVEIESGEIKLLAQFVPTNDFIEIIPFFDQYHHSMTIWSPDSTQIVYTGLDEDDEAAVWVVQADGSAQPERMAAGTLAVWSWR